MFISLSLKHYKRPEVRQKIVEQAENKEVSVMYGPDSFGKRPDTIEYSNDVLEFAKRKSSSFHCSEELWSNPLAIRTGMKRTELDEIRIGWDLILDIDCPDWDFSRLIAHLFVRALKELEVSSVTAKFSGNKGFHVAVPFEAFPEQIHFEGELHQTKNLFPEGPRKIASYLLGYITEHFAHVKSDSVVFDENYEYSVERLMEIASKTSQSLFAFQCPDCSVILEKRPEAKVTYQCSNCGHISKPSGNPEFIRCNDCNNPVEPTVEHKGCPGCGSYNPPKRILNLLAVVEVDTILIASRHLYRMPYSLHEKSRLVSVPVDPDRIMSFEKEQAKPENIRFDIPFLDRSRVPRGEAHRLMAEAFGKELQELGHIHADLERAAKPVRKSFEAPTDAIEKEYFPPCIHKILAGLEDGRKRALFVLINFLRTCGWNYEQVESLIYEWNENNAEPLREQYLKSQLIPVLKGKKIVPPPNCDNKDYYLGIGICEPDNFCSRIKNPAAYARKKKELATKSRTRSSKRSGKTAKSASKSAFTRASRKASSKERHVRDDEKT